MAQVPILMYLFWSSIRYLKKKKASTMLNRVISITVFVIANIAYAILIIWFLLRCGFLKDTSDYRTVTWQLTETISHDYKRYSYEIPLTCEDLYGEIDYVLNMDEPPTTKQTDIINHL